jgi:LPXTG-motif cell wall-anchored protein
MEDMSTQESFWEVSSRYLANAKPLGISWQVWLMIIIVLLIILGTWWWFRKKNKNKKIN